MQRQRCSSSESELFNGVCRGNMEGQNLVVLIERRKLDVVEVHEMRQLPLWIDQHEVWHKYALLMVQSCRCDDRGRRISPNAMDSSSNDGIPPNMHTMLPLKPFPRFTALAKRSQAAVLAIEDLHIP